MGQKVWRELIEHKVRLVALAKSISNHDFGTSTKYFDHCEAPYTRAEFATERKGMNQSKRPGMSGLGKRTLFHADKKFWNACCVLLNVAKENGHQFKDFKVALIVFLDKVAGDPSLMNKRPMP